MKKPCCITIDYDVWFACRAINLNMSQLANDFFKAYLITKDEKKDDLEALKTRLIRFQQEQAITMSQIKEIENEQLKAAKEEFNEKVSMIKSLRAAGIEPGGDDF